MRKPGTRSGRGFTIVELLVVISIIGILIGLVSIAVGGSLKNGRAKRADAMCSVLQQAVAMYYSKTGQWPKSIESKANNMTGEKDTYTFTPSETDAIFQEIVRKSTGSGATMALLDASALFVADSNRLRNNGEGCYDNHGERDRSSFCGDQHCVTGTDFTRASKTGKGNIPLSSMAFGYQATKSGKFSRYWITYNSKTDTVKVTRKNPGKDYPEDWE